MKTPNDNTAEKWALNLWGEAAEAWNKREQDFNYRNLVARPGFEKAISTLKPIHNAKVLDFGCAEGAETVNTKSILETKGFSGDIYGYDTQESFTNEANQKYKDNSSSEMSLKFGSGDFATFLQDHQIENGIDLVTSHFVLQDLPDLYLYLSLVDKALKQNGVAIFTIVHPEFAEALKKVDAIQEQTRLKIDATTDDSWRFAAKYPIVEVNGNNFYVPYFHRSIDDYRTIMKKYFSQVEFIPLQPSQEVLNSSKNKLISPFSDHENNVYFPMINEMPSSLIIIATK